MNQPENHRLEKWIRYALIVLAVLLVVLLIILFWQYQALRRQQWLDSRELHSALFLEHHAPLPVSEAGVIRPWMTFDYLDKLFALPPEYLKARLGITASNYPWLTLSSYATEQHLDAATFLNEVENAVLGYPSSSTPTSPVTATSTGAGAYVPARANDASA